MSMRLVIAEEKIDLRCDDERLRTNVRRLLEPAFFGPGDDSSAAAIVELFVGTFVAPALDRDRPWRMPPVLLFDETLEGALRILEHDGRISRLLREPERDGVPLLVHVDREHNRWKVESPSSDLAAARSIARLLKYLMGCLLVKRGCAVLHTSCVEDRGRGIMFFGPKGGGKTSFMFHACTKAGATLVSDDELVAWSDREGRVRCSGWPRRVGIPLSVLTEPERCREVARARFRRDDAVPPGWVEQCGDHQPPESRQRLMMDTDELLSVFSIDYRHAVSPGLLVALRARPELGGGWRMRPGPAVDVSELSVELKQLKLYVDYLGITPSPLGPPCRSTLQESFSELTVVTLEYGLESFACFSPMWAELLEHHGASA